MRDAAAERPQQEHQAGGVDQEQHALQLRHQRAHHRREPLVGPELGRRGHPHADEEEQEERLGGLRPHLAGGDVGGDALGRGYGHRHRHHQVDGRGHQDGCQLDLPAGVERLGHRDREQPADDHAARPPGVEHVEPLGLLIAVDGRDQRIDDAFDQPLRQPHHEEAGVEQRRPGIVEDRLHRRASDAAPGAPARCRGNSRAPRGRAARACRRGR